MKRSENFRNKLGKSCRFWKKKSEKIGRKSEIFEKKDGSRIILEDGSFLTEKKNSNPELKNSNPEENRRFAKIEKSSNSYTENVEKNRNSYTENIEKSRTEKRENKITNIPAKKNHERQKIMRHEKRCVIFA